MKVYQCRIADESMVLMVDRSAVPDTHPIHSDFTGQSLADIWTSPTVFTKNSGKSDDFPYFLPDKPIISAEAEDIILPYIKHDVELLSLNHITLQFKLVNVTTILDCVDYTRSEITLTAKGKLARFNKLVLDFDLIPEDTYIFKIREIARSRVFVTDKFKQVIDENNLKGLSFTTVFYSEDTLEHEQEQNQKFEAALQEIERTKGVEFDYEEARKRMEQGKAVACGKWKLQLNEAGEVWLGKLEKNLQYHWGMPVYIPPVLLFEKWHEVERAEIQKDDGGNNVRS